MKTRKIAALLLIAALAASLLPTPALAANDLLVLGGGGGGAGGQGMDGSGGGGGGGAGGYVGDTDPGGSGGRGGDGTPASSGALGGAGGTNGSPGADGASGYGGAGGPGGTGSGITGATADNGDMGFDAATGWGPTNGGRGGNGGSAEYTTFLVLEYDNVRVVGGSGGNGAAPSASGGDGGAASLELYGWSDLNMIYVISGRVGLIGTAPGGEAILHCLNLLRTHSLTVTKNDGPAIANIGNLMVTASGTTITNNGGDITIGTLRFESSSTWLTVANTGTLSITKISLTPPATPNGGSSGFSVNGLTASFLGACTLDINPIQLTLNAGDSITLLTSTGGMPAAWAGQTFGSYITEVSGNNLLLRKLPPSATVQDVTITGTAGAPLPGGQTATISLITATVGGALAGVDVSGWFTGLPAGISVTATASAGGSSIALAFSGTPTAAAALPFDLAIPAGVLTGGAALPVTANPNAGFAIGAAPPPSAIVQDVTVTGVAGSPLPGGQTATIALTNATVASALAGVNASGWFTGLPAGITVTATAPAGGSSITLTFSGTPTAVAASPFNLTIPAGVLTGGIVLPVAANPNAGFAIAAAPPPGVSAAVSNTTITGVAGTPLPGGQTATITLTNATVASALAGVNASGWFTGLPAGITVAASAPSGGNTITLTFSGTPTAAAASPFNLTIPAGVLTGGIVLPVAANPNAGFAIAAAPPPPGVSAAVSNTTITGAVGTPLPGGQRATISLTNATVASALAGVNASGWFTGLPAGITVAASAPAGGNTITLTFGGTPTATATSPFNLTIPAGVLTGGIVLPVAANPNAGFAIAAAPQPSPQPTPQPTLQPTLQPPSALPKTGDGFPLHGLLALLGVGLVALAWAGTRLRKRRGRAGHGDGS